jgi:hypothetical protein
MIRNRKLVLAGAAALPWIFFWIIFLDFLRPRYSYLHKAVSELGALGAPYGVWMDVCGFGITGLLLLAFAVGYKSVLKERAHGWILLLVTALLFIGTATPLTMTPGADPNPDYSALLTRTHLFFAVSAPIVWLAGLFFITCLRTPKSLKWLSAGVVVALGGLFLATALGAFAGSPGLVQRMVFALFFSWYALAAMFLIGMKQGDAQHVVAAEHHPAARAARH